MQIRIRFLHKMVGLVILSVLIASGVIGFLANIVVFRSFDVQARGEIMAAREVVEQMLADRKIRFAQAADFIAGLPEVANAVDQGDTFFLQQYGAELMARVGAGFIV
ncbi:MAG: hypothetical protein ACLFPR_02005, partial [Desulfococcaceae bacterium]